MNISRMRKIDRYAGGAICLMLDLIERIRRVFPRRDARPKPRSILVTKYLGMGSILLATPAFKAVKDQYPECRITMLTFAENAPFVHSLTVVDEVITIRTSSLPALILDTLSALREVRKRGFDYLLDLEFFARYSTIISYLSGATCRVGYYMPQIWRGDLLHIPVHFNPYRHVSEIINAQVEAIGVNVNGTAVTPPEVDPKAVEKVRDMLLDAGAKPEIPLVAININASDLSPERKWPERNFVRLMESLSATDSVNMVMIGSTNDRNHVASVFDALSENARSRTLNLAGKTNMDELIALLSLCDSCITNDSGPLHIAASLGVRTVSFFGPESPQLYGPLGEGHTLFYAGIYCSPCLNVYNAKKSMCNGNNLCMQAIEPDRVIEALLGKDTVPSRS